MKIENYRCDTCGDFFSPNGEAFDLNDGICVCESCYEDITKKQQDRQRALNDYRDAYARANSGQWPSAKEFWENYKEPKR